MGLLALVCAVLLLILIPNEIWAMILYLCLIGLVGVVGFTAFIMWVASGPV